MFMSEDALTIFAVDKPRTIRNLRKQLVEARDAYDLRAATDWTHYQRLLGTIDGIELAIKLLEDIEKQDAN